MFLVVAIDLQSGGLQVRYDIISIIASIATSVVVSAAVLWLVAFSASTVVTLLGGAFIGGVMALDCFQALTAIRVNAVVNLRPPMIIAVVVLMAIATAAAVLLSLRAPSRAVVTGTATFLAVMMTAAHYLNLHAVNISEPVARTVTTGIVPTAVILPVAIIFIIRFLLLLLVLLADTATTPSPSSEARIWN